MINFFMNNVNILGILVKKEECNLLGTELNGLLQEVFMWIQIAVPILVFVLCIVDMVQAVISQDEKGMKIAQGKTIKRIIIGIAIFFVPIILNIVLELAGIISGTCEIGG